MLSSHRNTRKMALPGKKIKARCTRVGKINRDMNESRKEMQNGWPVYAVPANPVPLRRGSGAPKLRAYGKDK